MKKVLTAAALSALKPTGAAYYVSDAKQDGLRIRVAPSGGLTWVVTFRIKGGGVNSVSLGAADPSGRIGKRLAEARERAAAIVKAARDGRHLLAEERAERGAKQDALTLEQLITRYSKHIASPQRRGGPLRTSNEIERRLRRTFTDRLSDPADSLRRADFSFLLDEVAERLPREAEKRRQSAHAMFVWATAKGFVPTNPLSGSPSYGTGEPRDRVLSAEEIRALWGWLDAGANNMPRDIISVLRLQLLLGARVGEIAGMHSDELSSAGDKLLWTLPASRSKNKKPRVTPLVGRARLLVESAVRLRKGALYRTLGGERSLTSTDVGQALLNRIKARPLAHFTTHDLRRTVVSKMDELGIALDTIAATIGHQRGSPATQVLVRHYSRPSLDRHVETALTAWDGHLAEILSGGGLPTNVIRLAGIAN